MGVVQSAGKMCLHHVSPCGWAWCPALFPRRAIRCPLKLKVKAALRVPVVLSGDELLVRWTTYQLRSAPCFPS